MHYQIADFIIRVKNASLARRKTVVTPYSRMNKALGNILVKEHFLQDIKEADQDGKKALVATVSYDNRKPVVTNVLIISKPSLRIYENAKNMGKLQKKGFGITIVSTSLGVMTSTDAFKKKSGGEVLFKVW